MYYYIEKHSLLFTHLSQVCPKASGHSGSFIGYTQFVHVTKETRGRQDGRLFNYSSRIVNEICWTDRQKPREQKSSLTSLRCRNLRWPRYSTEDSFCCDGCTWLWSARSGQPLDCSCDRHLAALRQYWNKTRLLATSNSNDSQTTNYSEFTGFYEIVPICTDTQNQSKINAYAGICVRSAAYTICSMTCLRYW